MFTGIIQATGCVRSLQRETALTRLVLDAPGIAAPIPLGSSIAVSGVCLTVTATDLPYLSFDVVPETLARTTLGSLSPGDRVNLERSLRAGDPLDGHVVQGHVDGTAVVQHVDSGEEGHVVTFEADEELMRYIIPKGS